MLTRNSFISVESHATGGKDKKIANNKIFLLNSTIPDFLWPWLYIPGVCAGLFNAKHTLAEQCEGFFKKKTLNAKLHESFSIHQVSVSKRTMEIAVILLQYNKIKKSK